MSELTIPVNLDTGAARMQLDELIQKAEQLRKACDLGDVIPSYAQSRARLMKAQADMAELDLARVRLGEREPLVSVARPIVTDEMVSRFLAWRVPTDFAPDCGISFDGRGKDARGYEKSWPTGTNLLTAIQARQMLEHVLAEPQED